MPTPLPDLDGLTLSDWEAEPTPSGVLVTLTLGGRHALRFTVPADDAEALASDLRLAADEWGTMADDAQAGDPPPGWIEPRRG